MMVKVFKLVVCVSMKIFQTYFHFLEFHNVSFIIQDNLKTFFLSFENILVLHFYKIGIIYSTVCDNRLKAEYICFYSFNCKCIIYFKKIRINMERGIISLWHKLKLSKPYIFAFLMDKAFDISNFDNYI